MLKETLPECPVETTLSLISNKWKVLILRELMEGTKRFSQIKNAIQGITQKVLTSNLRDMEESGLLKRKIYPEVPPRVEYTLTEVGESLSVVLDSMKTWGTSYKEKIASHAGNHSSLDDLAQKKILACRVVCDYESAEYGMRFSHTYDCIFKEKEIYITLFQPKVDKTKQFHLRYEDIASLRFMIVRVPNTTMYGLQCKIALDILITMKHNEHSYHLETMAFPLLKSMQEQLIKHNVSIEDPLSLIESCDGKRQDEVDAMFLDTYETLMKTYGLDQIRTSDVRHHQVRNCM